MAIISYNIPKIWEYPSIPGSFLAPFRHSGLASLVATQRFMRICSPLVAQNGLAVASAARGPSGTGVLSI